MDTKSKEDRSRNMAAIKSKNTKPEVLLRRLLHAKGYRFRIHCRSLPGQPDIVLKKYKTLIFVNGCFWHYHENCRLSKMPKSNQDYWSAKLKRNVERDKKNVQELENRGWNVITVWECELKKENEIVEKVVRSIREFSSKEPVDNQL